MRELNEINDIIIDFTQTTQPKKKANSEQNKMKMKMKKNRRHSNTWMNEEENNSF